MEWGERLAMAWPGTMGEALEVQAKVAEQAVLGVEGPAVGDVRRVAGVDVSYDKGSERLVAAAAVLDAVLDAVTLEPLETVLVEGVSQFPYIPGLLAFRELPSVMEALQRVKATPDLIVCDGYGIAHPRRAGLAVHLGVLTGLPCFGVANTPFVFDHEPPGPRGGDSAPLTADGGEVVGRALRTQAGVKPVFVSVGSGIGLDHACEHALRLAPRHRLPETTRWADRLSRARLREVAASAQSVVGPGGA